MTWNYRVFAELVDEERCFSIRSVYYDDDGQPHMYSVHDASPYGGSLKELKQDMEYFNAALEKPILTASTFKRRTKRGKQKVQGEVRDDSGSESPGPRRRGAKSVGAARPRRVRV